MTATDPRIDRQRGAVYVAEDRVSAIMSSANRAVRLNRRVVMLPAAITFGSLETISGFVAAALTHPATISTYPAAGPVRVVSKRGFRSASYSQGQIAIPAADSRGRWALAQSVVLHEIAHHLAGVPGHGRAFRSALVHLYSIHLGPEAAELLTVLFEPLESLPEPACGLPDVADAGALRRVAALLAKAESTTSEDEAAAYLAKANLVAHRHSIDLAVAALAGSGPPPGPTHRMLTIGAPRGSMNKALVSLFIVITAPWQIPVDVGPSSSYVLAFGLPRDLDHVEALYATAAAMMAVRAQEHVSAGMWRDSTYLAPRSDGRVERRPVNARIARNAFIAGFTERLGARLAETVARDRQRGRSATPQAEHASHPSVALALREKALAVTNYHRSASRAKGSWRASASTAATATSSRRAGQAAADEFGRTRLGGKTRAAIES